MLRSLAGIGRVLSRVWPALLAWYLAGQVVRAAIIAIASPIGPESPLAALVLVPIAALAVLVSYVGMFLAVRRAMPVYRELADGDVEFQSLRDAAAEFSTVLLASIIPFFTLYALIGLLAKDLSDYARSAFRYSIGSENGVLDVGDGPLVVIVIVVALTGRIALKIFGSRLPKWLAIIEIYLEATWIFVAITGLTGAFGQIIGWINDRRLVQWFTDARELVMGLGEPVRRAIESIDGLVPAIAHVVLLPLAWLLIAGIVYTRTLANIDHSRLVPERISGAALARFERLPAILRRQAFLVTDEWDDIGGPFTQSGQLIRRAGIVNLAIFMAAYGILFAARQWTTWLIYRLVGPHDGWFWSAVDPVLSLASSLVVEPVRVVLLAVTFDLCLRRWQQGAQRKANSYTPGVPVTEISTTASS
jgi:hypothetical protein